MTLLRDELALIDAYWRAANYLSVGQIYLLDNPLLHRPLIREDIKPRLLGHWGTTPGLNFVYAHLNRLIGERDLDAIYVTGPGHGGPGLVANAYLEGTYSEVYPHIGRDERGLGRLFRQFSFPGGIPSHVAPETPGSIHEGGELGYSLVHAYGAAFDNPDLLVACVIGDGEAETGPLAGSWHSNKFLNPVRDGAVLPILHLNGYKIANPTVLARIPHDELEALLHGFGHEPIFVEGHEPEAMHQAMATAMTRALDRIAEIQSAARHRGETGRLRWPMIVLRTPKGWTGPKEVDGQPVEGTFRAHQVPLAGVRENPEHLAQLEAWMRSYRPEELFDHDGTLRAELAALPPTGSRRMSANPHANGGLLLRDLELPDFRAYAVDVPSPATSTSEATRVLGEWLRDVVSANPDSFRIMGPDETASNRLAAVFEVTNRAWEAEIVDGDDHLAPEGQVMEVLSEHLCQGWLEGYLLTGRHGLFNCYEAFIHIIDAMFNQHAKWLKVTRGIPWRAPIASLNYLLSSHVWRQDHNGFSHQDPGFIDHVVNKKAEIVRVYLPPDANCLLSVGDHCLRSRDYVNVIVAGKQPALNYLTMDEAIAHCTRGLGIWEWASTDHGGEPDVVLACAGDIPTLETVAAAALLREHLPDLAVRVINVVDLMRLQPETEHPHGLSDREFDALFTTSRPVIFAYHGYPTLIHRLTYRRANHHNIHVRGYKEEGTTTTPFDMVMLNDLDRYHLVIDVIDRVPELGEQAAGRAPAYGRRPPPRPGLHPRARRRPARGPRLDLARRPAGPDRRGLDRQLIASRARVRILTVNAGSSSLKLSLIGDQDETIAEQEVPAPQARIDPAELARVLDGPLADADAVAHRIVHGGERFREAVLIDPGVTGQLRRLTDLAPLHQPKSLAALDAVSERLPDLPAVACFDTAFHATLPPAAFTYALPARWRDRWGLRRFGFHGLSHGWVARRAPELLGDRPTIGRLISCHLGAGASLCAIADGRSQDTTMGFTPLDGLVMATRSGSVDPGMLLWLLEREAVSEREMAEALEHESGLAGLAGSADMQTVLAAAGRGEPEAVLAIDVYLHHLRAGIAAMAAALGGLDALVFTGGVGERSSEIRARAVAGLGFLGVAIDPAENRSPSA